TFQARIPFGGPWPSLNGHAVQPDQQASDATEKAKQAAAALLGTLSTVGAGAQEDAVLDALPALTPLDTISWIRLKRQLKAAVPALNMNDLERARNELRHASVPTVATGTAQAQIAAALAQQYTGKLAYDMSREAWMAYTNGLWAPIDGEMVRGHMRPTW